MALSEKKGFFNFFPTPEYLLLSTCGIAITDDNVKFIQFKRGLFSNTLKLTHYDKIPLPAGTVQSGYINDAEKLSATLKAIASKYGVRYARATLPEERAYLFTAKIDRVPPEGLRDAVAFIVEENVPVSLDSSVFDFDVVEDIASSPQIKVTVAVLSKKVVDFYIQVFESSGITPIAFDIESQAIAHAIIPRGDKRTQMVIRLSHTKTGFYIVEDEVVQFTTTLPVGSLGAPPYPHINDLKIEIRKIFAFWSSRSVGPDESPKHVEKILLCGIGASNNPFVSLLMSDSPVEYSRANPWVNISLGLQRLSQRDISKEALDYVAPIGLALPHLEKTYV